MDSRHGGEDLEECPRELVHERFVEIVATDQQRINTYCMHRVRVPRIRVSRNLRQPKERIVVTESIDRRTAQRQQPSASIFDMSRRD